MSFEDWLLSSYPNPVIDGKYGILHISTLVLCILLITITTKLVKNRSVRCKRVVLIVYATIILFFEIARRVINFHIIENYNYATIMYTLMPRPGCAISCWLIIISTVVNKRFMYNATSIIAFLCGFAFFVHPAVGFNNEYILFENLYSIVTHFLLFATSVCYITFGFTRFTYKDIWKDLLGFAGVAGYVYWEISIAKIDADPFYFMPGSEIQTTLGLSYDAFICGYIAIVMFYVSLFYLIQRRTDNKRILKERMNKPFWIR